MFQVTQFLAAGDCPKYPIPDYKQYTVGEHTPELLKLEKMLAEKGLKDPWIRNNAWRYDMRDKMCDSPARGLQLITRGIIPGAILGFVAALGWWQFEKSLGHGHGHH